MSRRAVRKRVGIAAGVMVACLVGPLPSTGAAEPGSEPLPPPDGVTLVEVADAALSDDGRWVVYAASAAAAPTPGAAPVWGLYLADRSDGTAVRLDVDVDSDERIAEVDVSDDATRIVFRVGERDVVEGQEPAQVHVHDRVSGATTLVSAREGQPGDGPSFDVEVSGDGEVVAFATESRRLLDLPPGEAWVSGVVAVEVADGELEVLSSRAGRASAPSLGADGDLVAYSTDDPTLPGDLSDDTDVVLHDRTTDSVVLVTTGEGGGTRASLSADGSVVVWSRVVRTVKPGVPLWGTWATDLSDGSRTRVDVDAEGEEILGVGGAAVVSADGGHVLLDGLRRTDRTSAVTELFLHDLDTGSTGIVPLPPTDDSAPVLAVGLSADGAVALHSGGLPALGRTYFTEEVGELLPVPPAPPRPPDLPGVPVNTAPPTVERTATRTSYAFTLKTPGQWESEQPLERRYSWLRDGEQATHATGTTLEVRPEDVGQEFTLVEVVNVAGQPFTAVQSRTVKATKAPSRLRVTTKERRAGRVAVTVRLSHAWGVRPQGRVVVRWGRQLHRLQVDGKGPARVVLPGAPRRRTLRVAHRATPIVRAAAPVRRTVRATR